MRRFGMGFVVMGCAQNPAECPLEGPFDAPDRPNVLVVVIDDVGIDQFAPWNASSETVPAPTMDCLCDAGLRFDTVWASPFCTPARAALLTGQHPRREGIGRFVNVDTAAWELPLARTTVAEALANEGYATAFFGKWHLGSKAAPTGGRHPNEQGFDHFSGTLGNIKRGPGSGRSAGYEAWEHLENGEFSARRGYLTSATVDDALAGIAALPEPWLVVVSFNGAHEPLHRPPRRLLEQRVSRRADAGAMYRAMVQSVDAELGRLIDEIAPDSLGRTQIWTMSDNGSIAAGLPSDAMPNRSKGTLYEGGVRIPLVVAGAGVPQRGEVSEALVSILDVFPTLLEQVGASPRDGDGRSLRGLFEDPDAPHHEVLYADVTNDDGTIDRAVRDLDHKVVRRGGGPIETWRLLGGLEEELVDVDAPALEIALESFEAAYAAD